MLLYIEGLGFSFLKNYLEENTHTSKLESKCILPEAAEM